MQSKCWHQSTLLVISFPSFSHACLKASLPFNVIRQGRFQQMFQPFSCICTPITRRRAKWQTAQIKSTPSACHSFLAALHFPLSRRGSEPSWWLSVNTISVWFGHLILVFTLMSFLSAPVLLVAMLKKKKKICSSDNVRSEPSQPAEGVSCDWMKLKSAPVLFQSSNYLITVIILPSLSVSTSSSMWLKSRFGFNLATCRNDLSKSVNAAGNLKQKGKNGAQMEEENLKCWASAVVVMAVGLVGGVVGGLIGMCNKL